MAVRIRIITAGMARMVSIPQVSDLDPINAHIANTSNPHNVTHDQTSPAANQHRVWENSITQNVHVGNIPNLPASIITSGTFADARISESSVVQHRAALLPINVSSEVTGRLPFANLAQVSGFSILGKPSTGAGDAASITAAADQVLRRSGSGNLAFGTLVTNNIGNSQVTLVKIQNISTDRILGRATAGSGVTEELTPAGVRTMINVEDGAEANAVDSVFGRTGAVVAETNDYTWAQINKTVSDIADIATRSHASLTDIGTNTHAQIDSHIGNTSNPHSVLHSQVSPVANQHRVWENSITQNVHVDNIPNLPASIITSGTFADARISESSVTQHQAAIDIASSQITDAGLADGVATLDGGGKVPVAQLPNSIMEYKGTWDASTNTPTLSDGTGNTGDVYRVTVAGSHDFGSGSISFDVGDYAIYNASGVWEKSDTTDSVATVFGRTGNVVAQSGDYSFSQLSGSIGDGQVPASVVTQHEGSIDHNALTNYAVNQHRVWENSIAQDVHVGNIPNLPASIITSGTFADARISQSSVIQHQAAITGVGALNSGSITSGFGTIDIGSSALTAGAGTFSSLLHAISSTFTDHLRLTRSSNVIDLSVSTTTNALIFTAENTTGYSTDARVSLDFENKQFKDLTQTNAWDLGASDRTWRDLHLGRNATIGGSLGVGTTGPQGLLHIKGADPIHYIQDTESASTSAEAYTYYSESDAGGDPEATWRVGYNLRNFSIGFSGNIDSTAVTDYFVITDAGVASFSGNLGIGTTDPQYPLGITTDSLGGGIQIRRNSATTGEKAGVGFRMTTTESIANHVELIAELTNSPNALDNKVIIRNRKSGAISDSVIVDSAGHVTPGLTGSQDLGTSSLKWRNLRMSGNIFIDGGVAGDMEIGVTSGFLADSLTIAANDILLLGTSTADSVFIGTNGTSRILVNSTGEVAINTTVTPERLTVNGNIQAIDFITASRVADVNNGKRALSRLDNIKKWRRKDGGVNYQEHYAHTQSTYYVNDDDGRPLVDEEGNLVSETQHGLSMETRVSEMEKMIWELMNDLEQLKN